MSERKRDLDTEIRRVLDEEAARLDPATRMELLRARRRALERMLPERTGVARYWWLPAGAVLASGLLVLLVWHEHRIEVAPVAMPAPADFELLTGRDSLDLYRNLDFYLWLEQERRYAG